MSERISCDLLELRPLTDNILCMRLLPQYPFKYRAGQYVELYQSNGDHRPYSIANAPVADGSIEFHIRYKISDPFPDDLLNAVKQEKSLDLTGPYGHCVLPDTKPAQIVLICGGTGFAPHKALIEECIEEQAKTDIHLFWSIRAKRDLYDLPLIERWQKEIANFHFTPILTDQITKVDLGSVIAKEFPNLANIHVYLAGPFPMLLAAKAALLDLGLPDGQCYSDM